MDIKKSITISDIRSKETFRALDEAAVQNLLDTIIMYCSVVYETACGEDQVCGTGTSTEPDGQTNTNTQQIIPFCKPNQKDAA